MDEEIFTEYALMFKALSDPTRIKIVKLLSNEENECDCSTNILKHLNITQPTLSYHMKFLSEAKLVLIIKDGTFRRYKLDFDKFHKLHNFIMSMDPKSTTKE